MNLAFYGHSRTLVNMFTQEGKFMEYAVGSGIKLIHEIVLSGIELRTKLSEANMPGFFYKNTDPANDDFRRDYYGMRRYDKNQYNVYKGREKKGNEWGRNTL